MICQEFHFVVRGPESISRLISFVPYLYAGQVVTGAVVQHTPPAGGSVDLTMTATPVSESGAPGAPLTHVLWSGLGPLIGMGYHMCDVVATLSLTGETKTARFWVRYAG